MTFHKLGVIKLLRKTLHKEGYEAPTPIQQQAIRPAIDGRDILGCAQTGTGKTAAFALPILQRLNAAAPGDKHRPIRALIITPTRELAAQVAESFRTYGRQTPLRAAVVHGGVRKGPQIKALKHGVDVLVATPGRLLDLMGDRHVKLDRVEVLVLDEADRMLDMGFIEDIRKIVAAVPDDRQTMLFSATIPPRIKSLADWVLHDPEEIRIAPEAPAAETVEQRIYLVEARNKQALLEHLLADEDVTRALIFTRTKIKADRVAERLSAAGIEAKAMHSDKPQNVRKRRLERFKSGRTRVLVASDIAARGLDVEDISHVINFDLPDEAEVYVHRIGRTGRAGAGGQAISFCGIEEREKLDAIERLLGRNVGVITDHPFPSPLPRRDQQEQRPRGLGRFRIRSKRPRRLR
ncbi:MAG: DEAD/DEAH box helicase [Phycisphaerae bacterium]|nr:DEAD/DEAH box helicase [Phycisphaerae bacterium]